MKTKSRSGNIYVMVMTDAFSKVVELAAIPDKTAETIARTFFQRWICRYSVPLQVVSDNGKEFANELFTYLCDLLGCKQTKTTPYHPASNSSAESFNRSMKKYLRAMLDNSQTLEWEEQLPMLQLSYNCHVHRSTLESPFWLTHFQDPRLPYTDLEAKRPIYRDDFITATYEMFSETHKLVHKNQWDARKIREEYYNRKAKERIFNVGDRVLFFHNAVPKSGVNAKLWKNWQGPYYVVKVVNPLNYVIQKNPNSKQKLVNIEKIKHLSEQNFKLHFDSKAILKRSEEVRKERKAKGITDPATAERDSDCEESAENYELIKESAHEDNFAGSVPEEAESAIPARRIMESYADQVPSDPAPIKRNNSDFVRTTRSKTRGGQMKLNEGL